MYLGLRVNLERDIIARTKIGERDGKQFPSRIGQRRRSEPVKAVCDRRTTAAIELPFIGVAPPRMAGTIMCR